MAAWSDFCALAERLGATKVNDTMWRFDLPGRKEHRTQKVFVLHEVMAPDFEFIVVKSAFVMVNEVDCEQVLKGLGQLQVGAIGYSPLYDGEGQPIDGFLNISSSLPLAALDFSDPTAFLLYLHLLGQAADDIEKGISSPGALDRF